MTDLYSVPRCMSMDLWQYRGTSLITKRHPLGPYTRTMPRDIWWPWGGVRFLMSEVPLYTHGGARPADADVGHSGRGYMATSLIRNCPPPIEPLYGPRHGLIVAS